MNDVQPVEQEVAEAGYPVAELNEAIDIAQEMFCWALADHPEGDNWSGEHPRDLANAVDRNARSAAIDIEEGDYTAARKEIGDALNYLLFLQAVLGEWEVQA